VGDPVDTARTVAEVPSAGVPVLSDQVLAKAIQGEDVAALGKRFSGCFAPNVSPAESA